MAIIYHAPQMIDLMDIVKQAQADYQCDKDAFSKIYQKARDDLKFISDDPNAQWDEQDYNARVQTGRPALTIDQLGQFIHQVANEIRMNTPSINVIPSDAGANEANAEIFKGLIREIEYHSNADDVYDTAALNAIRCSIGFIRADFEYEDDTFDQRLVIRRVVNPLSVFLDSDSVECDGRDAKRGTILEAISVEDFKKKWPDKAPISFTDSASEREPSDKETIYYAEHFRIDEEYETITNPLNGEETREIVKKKVTRYLLSGQDVLEESTFPGKYIPIIPVYGEEAWIDGERQIYSLIRKSKSAQQMFNYWKSLETELLMKAPQAPVMAAEGQVEDYSEDWKNPSKTMVLRYKGTDDAGNPVPPPQRLEPPVIPIGIVNAARQTVDDIKATMGIYNSNLGMMGNEISGVAIRQRQGEGDVATYHFQDNLVRSITQLGRVLVSAIPEVYSNARVIRILGMEDEPRLVGINGALADGQPQTVNLARGKYEVRVKTGGSYTTKRQEAAEFLDRALTSNPELMNVMGDLLFENLDFAGANVMAERMRKLIDPKFLDDEADPQVIALNQALEQQQLVVQEMQAALAQAQQQIQDKQAEMMLKAQELKIKQAEAQAKAIDAQQDNQLSQERLRLEALKEENSRIIDQARLELDKYKADLELVKIQSQSQQQDAQSIVDVVSAISAGLERVASMNAQTSQALEERIMRGISAPKRVLRDANGDIIGVETSSVKDKE